MLTTIFLATLMQNAYQTVIFLGNATFQTKLGLYEEKFEFLKLGKGSNIAVELYKGDFSLKRISNKVEGQSITRW